MTPKISKYQLFCLFVLFEIGSTTLYAPGVTEAKQDAWIAVLIAMLIGFVLLWIFTKIQKQFPEKNFTEIMTTLLGKPIGGLLAITYAFYFISISIFNASEFSDLINMTFLSQTPRLVIVIIFIGLSMYIIFKGLEVISRMAEIMIPIVLLGTVLTYILIIISGQVDFKELTPVLGNGIEPVLKAAFPSIVVFPFGEMIIFLVYWNYVEKKQYIRKMSYLAVGITGINLAIYLVIVISVLGVGLTSNTMLPFIEAVKLIHLGESISNLDAGGILLILIAGFYKMTLLFYGAVLTIKTLFNMKDGKWLTILIGIFIIYMSVYFIRSRSFHVLIGQQIFEENVHAIFQIVIPTILLIICWVRSKLIKK